MPSNPIKSRSSVPSSRCQTNTIPRAKPSRQTQSYVVLDVTLPSHIVNDRSLFTTYTPTRKVHRTAFGNDITIEGIGDAHIRVFAAGRFILFRMRDCWHVPSSPHTFLSGPMITSNGYQVMIAARSPRILFSNKCRLAEPKLPKYIPLTKVDGYFVLKFEIPIRGSVPSQPLSTASKTASQEVFSLHALAPQPFAGLSLAAHTKTSPSSEAIWVREPSVPPHKLYQKTPSIPFPLLNPFNSHSPPFNQFCEAPISTIPYPVPPFNPQSIQLPQRQLLPKSNPLRPQTSPSISPNTFHTYNSPSPSVPVSTNFSTLISLSPLQNPMSKPSCAGCVPAFTDSPTSILRVSQTILNQTSKLSHETALTDSPMSNCPFSGSLEPEICSPATLPSNSTYFPLAGNLPSLSPSEFFSTSLSSTKISPLFCSNLPLKFFPPLIILSNLFLFLENPP